jgi:hypothetical protein
MAAPVDCRAAVQTGYYKDASCGALPLTIYCSGFRVARGVRLHRSKSGQLLEGALMAGSVQHTAHKQRLAVDIPKCEAVVSCKASSGHVAIGFSLGIARVSLYVSETTDEYATTANLTRCKSVDEALWQAFTEPAKLPRHAEAKMAEPKAPYGVSWEAMLLHNAWRLGLLQPLCSNAIGYAPAGRNSLSRPCRGQKVRICLRVLTCLTECCRNTPLGYLHLIYDRVLMWLQLQVGAGAANATARRLGGGAMEGPHVHR